MQLQDLKPAPGATRRRKVVGRGPGSGHGKTSTRGDKGNKKRGQINPNFEGGQTPLHRRLPQMRGFKPAHKKLYAIVNVGTLDAAFEAGAEVTPEVLVERRIVREIRDGVKVLGDGELSKALTVRVHKFSASAKSKVEGAGGTLEVVQSASTEKKGEPAEEPDTGAGRRGKGGGRA